MLKSWYKNIPYIVFSCNNFVRLFLIMEENFFNFRNMLEIKNMLNLNVTFFANIYLRGIHEFSYN